MNTYKKFEEVTPEQFTRKRRRDQVVSSVLGSISIAGLLGSCLDLSKVAPPADLISSPSIIILAIPNIAAGAIAYAFLKSSVSEFREARRDIKNLRYIETSLADVPKSSAAVRVHALSRKATYTYTKQGKKDYEIIPINYPASETD